MARALRIVAAIVGCIAASGMAVAQKSGGVLREYQIDSPASMSIHEEATVIAERTVMPVFSNLVIFDQHIAQNSLEHDPARAGDRLGVGRGRQQAHLPPAQGRQMARRQAVHRRRRQVHLGPAAGQGGRKAARQPAQGLVQQPRRGQHQRRLRSYFRPEAAAAGVYRAARVWHVAGLSLPRLSGADAPAPDRHRPLQVRRVQAQRVRSSWSRTPITGSRGCLISTASTIRSSATARRSSWRSSPGNTT